MCVNETMHNEEKRNAGSVEWVEMSVRGDLWEMDSSKSEREVLKDTSETCYDVWR